MSILPPKPRAHPPRAPVRLQATAAAANLFQTRVTKKCYLALVFGHTAWDEIVEARGVGTDPSDPRGFRMAAEGSEHCCDALAATTRMFAVGRGTFGETAVTKLLLCPVTGRRHQLRIHTSSNGHPIVGDFAYTGDTTSPRMMLHAWRLQLPLPRLPAPVHVGTMDPFPAVSPPCSGQAVGAAASVTAQAAQAVLELPAEVDISAMLRELRGGDGARVPEGVTFAALAGSDRRHTR